MKWGVRRYQNPDGSLTRYEHDWDHTKRGKKLLKEMYDSDYSRKMAYAGADWFWKYARDLRNAEVKDYMHKK